MGHPEGLVGGGGGCAPLRIIEEIQQNFGKITPGSRLEFGSFTRLASPCLKVSGLGQVCSLSKRGS